MHAEINPNTSRLLGEAGLGHSLLVDCCEEDITHYAMGVQPGALGPQGLHAWGQSSFAIVR